MAKKKTTTERELSSDSSASREEIDSFEKEMIGVLQKDKDIHVEELRPNFVPYFIDTGNYALNWICSHKFITGGFPGTKVIMLEGENSKGKSLITARVLGNTISAGGMGWVVDTEDATNFEFIKTINNDKPEVAKSIKRIPDIRTVDQLVKKIYKIVDFMIAKKAQEKDIRLCLVTDSVSQLSSAKETEDLQKEKQSRDMTKAGELRSGMRSMNTMFFDANITPIFIAHLTEKIGVMFGDSKTAAAHGTSLLFSASLIIRLTSATDIKVPEYPIPVGVRMKLVTRKNRVVHKGKSCFVDLYFKTGVDRYSGLLELLNEFGIIQLSTKDMAASTKVMLLKKIDGIDPKFDKDGKREYDFKAKDFKLWLQQNNEERIINQWEEYLREIVEFKESTQEGIDILTTDDSEISDDEDQFLDEL